MQCGSRFCARLPFARCWTIAALNVLTAAATFPGLSFAQNLTGNVNVHDPSSVIQLDGRYYMFYTGNRVRTKTSDDLIDWDNGPRVFDERPDWTLSSVPGNNGSYWAPDVAYFNGLYHLYYSVSTFGSQDSAIGLATNPTLNEDDPAFEWTDHGPVIESNPGSPYNTIDPAIVQTSSGDVWMTFGSFWSGIFLVSIDPATGFQRIRQPTYQIAYNGSIEAPYIYERDDYYYLFVNWGSCCQGENSTYNIRVGRSTSITGPYLDQDGVNLINRGGTLFLGTEGSFIGPGHVSIFTDNGSDWFGYHYYDGNDNGASKYNIRAINWTEDGWPVAGAPYPLPEPTSLSLAMAALVLYGGLHHRIRGGGAIGS